MKTADPELMRAINAMKRKLQARDDRDLTRSTVGSSSAR